MILQKLLSTPNLGLTNFYEVLLNKFSDVDYAEEHIKKTLQICYHYLKIWTILNSLLQVYEFGLFFLFLVIHLKN